MHKLSRLLAKSAVAISLMFSARPCGGVEKEVALVTGEAVGELAVAGRLDIDLHAEFMLSRTFEDDTALNWYNCGFSGGGRVTTAGGNFGDFGLHVPHTERDDRYPKAVTTGLVPAVRFDGNDIMKGNFAVERDAAESEDMALEVWLQDENPAKGEVILGWQSADGTASSAALSYPAGFEGQVRWRHLVVNCSKDTEAWYVDSKKVGSGVRTMRIRTGHRMILGGAIANRPSFNGLLAAVRLHAEAMTEEQIAHNCAGGVMLGTELHNWWRTDDPDRWWVKESKHFRHCVGQKEMSEWNEKHTAQFHERVPGMFEMAEKLYHLYSERLAMRSSVVSSRPEFRGDGIKYKIAIQPSRGSWMGWDGKRGFGWACQGAGHINPHELVHGFQGMTGGTMQGNYWEAHANFPQTYAGVYQTIPAVCCSRVCMFFPANGRNYYHARLMFEHLAQTPEYGPMFISKLWYDGGTEESKNEYPWTAFTKLDPDPATPLAYEWTRMVQRCVTWDFATFKEGEDDLYAADAERGKAEMMRYARVLLERVPYDRDWWRPPKEMTPQQLAYNICPLTAMDKTVSAELAGYVSKERGSDWRLAFVGVTADGKPVYGDIVHPGEKLVFERGAAKELYLVVCATPTKVLPINMSGDYRSFEQEKFPYRVKLTGCEPRNVLLPDEPTVEGAPHPNGGGFIANSAQVAESAYVGPNAQVLGTSRVLDNARVEDHAVVEDATVRDNAVVSGHALVASGAVVQDFAKIRDCGRVMDQAVIKDYAKVLEHATQDRKPCGGYAVLKGVAWSSGNVSGTAMIDGSYRKGNDVDKGRWFTWSWGKGQNAGELDEEFHGLYMRMSFDDAHEWMARDDFAGTWGYLVGSPEVREDPASVQYTETADVVEDVPRFVLPRDPGETNPNAAHRWDHYGSLMSGYLHPPVTGDYVFRVYADDNAFVSLSTDADPANRKQICSSRVSGMRNYAAFPEQTSAPVRLEKGGVYYIEALFKAAGGGDYMGVAWRFDGQELAEIDGPFLSKTPDGPRGAMSARAWHNIKGNKVEDLTGDPRFCRGLKRTSNSVLALNGIDQFVELQHDVADMRDISIQVKVNWQGEADAPILDFSNAASDSVFLGVVGGKCVFAITRDGKSQSLAGPALEKGTWTEVLVVLSEDTGKLFIDGAESARNDRMTWNPDDVRATACYLGRGRDGGYFRGEIDALEIYSVPLKDEVAPSPDPAHFAVAPISVNPSTVVMQAVPGVDPLGGVEYLFEETSGNPGGDSSGWLKEPSYQDSGLTEGRSYTYRVAMRDTCGNVGTFSTPATVKWEGGDAFRSADDTMIVVEAENCTRRVPGAGDADGIEWKLSPKNTGCAGKGMMAALPDKGVQIGDAFGNQSPRLDYLINFPATGKYAIWMRSWGPNPNGDSVYFGLDMKTTDRALFHTDYGKLQWRRHGDWSIDVPTPGLHTLSVWMREDGCAFDRLIITHDLGLQMDDSSGAGPATSPRHATRER